MFNWFKKSRKNHECGSLQEVEQLLHSASYSAQEPTPEFKQELHQKLLRARRTNQSSSMETTPRFTFKWKVWVPALSFAVIILLLLPIVAPWFGQKNYVLIDRALAQTAFETVALDADQSGVSAETTFRITTKIPVDVDDLRANLRFEPEMKFDLKKVSETEFDVVPAAPLEAGIVYNVVIDAAYNDEKGVSIPKEFRFAFQVKDTFQVLKTLPGNKRDNAPTNTGIEVTFSHPTVKVEDFQKFFAIEPNVAGRFEKHSSALVFVPKKELDNSTLYTVILKKGLPLAETDQTLAENYSFQFFTQQNRDRSQGPNYFYFDYGSDFRVFTTSQHPEFQARTQDSIDPATKVTVYRVPSFEELKKRTKNHFDIPAWICAGCFDSDVDVKNLPVALDTTLRDTMQTMQTQNGAHILYLPAIQDRGIYILAIGDAENPRAEAIFQVSNLKAFATTSKKKSFVWVHDAESKKPVSSAAVTFMRDNISGKTDGQGVALVNTPECAAKEIFSHSDFMKVSTENDAVYFFLDQSCNVRAFAQSYYNYNASPNYWSTLSVDRPMYLPVDTAYFWGVSKRRINHKPETLTVELNDGAYDHPRPVLTKTVQSSGLGTFHGSLDLKNIPPNYYTLFVKNAEGEIITSTYFEVATFQKPLYDIKVSLDKQAVYVGEHVKATAIVSFFDGTPAKDLSLRYIDSFGTQKNVSTNNNGEVSVDVDTAKLEQSSNKDFFNVQAWMQVSFEPAKAEYGFIRGEANATIYRADRALNFSYPLGENNAVKGKLTEVGDLSNFGTDAFWQNNNPPGVPHHPIHGEIVRLHDEKTEAGEYYDPISKSVHKNFTYEQREESVKNFETETDYEGVFAVDFPFAKKEQYRISAWTTDGRGRETRATTTFYPQDNYAVRQDVSRKIITLRDSKSDGETAHKYVAGEKVKTAVYVDDKPFDGQGEFVYYRMQEGVTDAVASTSATDEFTFTEDDIPNVYAGVVWFDGTFYRTNAGEGYALSINFKKETKKLSIEIKPGQENYKPGEAASLEVTTKNAQGKPVSAEVNIKLVDEAIYALQQSYETTLNDLYRPLGVGILAVSNTSPDSRFEEGGKGGGGGEEPRRIFKLTPYFDSVKTDSSGHASVNFKLSDDVTTFRITGQGVTENLDAGSVKTKLTTSIPFFVDVTMNDVYLTSDTPSIRLRAIGKNIKKGEPVSYTIQEQHFEAKAGEDFWYALPKLTPGDHEITIRGESGGMKDAIAKKIHVVDSLLTVPVTETRTLAAGNSLADITAPRAKLVFSLGSYGEYYEALQELRWGMGSRLDARLAAGFAQSLLAKYYGEEGTPAAEDLVNYQNQSGAQSGALQLFPYDDADLDLSYRAAALLGSNETLNADRLGNYFDAIIENNDSNVSEVAAALAGKAALKQPVLNQLKLFLEVQRSKLKAHDKLVLAFGLAALGDADTANKLLDEVMSGNAKRDGESLLLGDDFSATALAGAVAAMASHSEAYALWNAAQKFRPTDTITNLDRAIMLDSFLKHLSPVQNGALHFTLGDRSETIKLKKAQTEELQVFGDDFKNISFSDISGPVSVTVYRELPFSQAGKSLSSSLKIARRYEVLGKPATTFEEGEYVRVILMPTISGKSTHDGVEIIDTLPAGLLPLTNAFLGGGGSGKGEVSTRLSYPNSVEGQRLTFHYYPSVQKEISYFARIVSKGTFTAEPAVIQSADDPSRLNLSESAAVEIK